jgi:hypothetical protein
VRGLGEVGVIEKVEHLNTEFQLGALHEVKVEGLGNGEIGIREIRPEDLISFLLTEVGGGGEVQGGSAVRALRDGMSRALGWNMSYSLLREDRAV